MWRRAGLAVVSHMADNNRQVAPQRTRPAVSDLSARLDRIIQLAMEVFGTKEKAIQWLKRPSRPLGSEMPWALLDTDAGTQRVEPELRQIQFGFVYCCRGCGDCTGLYMGCGLNPRHPDANSLRMIRERPFSLGPRLL
jgi:hypothetical protein